VQEIEAECAVELPFTDLRGEKDKRDRGRALMAEEARKPFDLGRGPVLRCLLLRVEDREHVLLMNMHHVVTDEWSLGILQRDLGALYEAEQRGGKAELKELPIQYADYAVWQRAWMKGEVLEEQLGYWKKQLEGMPGVLELPADKPRPAVQRYHGRMEWFEVSRELWEEVKKVSRREGATQFMTLLAAFEVLLERYSGQRDFAPTSAGSRASATCWGGCARRRSTHMHIRTSPSRSWWRSCSRSAT
jgi:hypothetical protein